MSGRRIMMLAARAMAVDRPEMACAMLAEHDAPARAGQGRRFALGCLIAAVRLLPFGAGGQAVVARSAVALVGVLPFAVFHLGCLVSGLRLLRDGGDVWSRRLLAGDATARASADLYLAMAPVMVALLAAMGVAHLVAVAALLRWRPVRLMQAMLVAALAAAGLVVAALRIMPNSSGFAVLGAALCVEVAALPLLVFLHRRQPAFSS